MHRALAVATLLALAACRETRAPVSTTPAGVARAAEAPIRVGLTSPPASLDLNEFLAFNVLSSALEGLVALDPLLRVQPALAMSWQSPDERHWRFEIRRGVVFHDRRPLTAADVVFSLERVRRMPSSQYASYLADVDGVRATGEYSVEISTSRPHAFLLNKLAFVLIVPHGSPDHLEQPIGTGPYRLTVADQGRTIALAAFDGYWGAMPPEPEVRFVSAGAKGRSQRLLAGELDVLMDLAVEDAGRVSQAAGFKVVSEPLPAIDVLWMRVAAPPFRDPRVRRAIHLALDRTALTRDLVGGYGRPATQLVGRNVFGFAPELSLATRDIARSRQLLAEAGHPNGLDLILEHRPEMHVEAIVQQLRDAGIRARPVARHWHALLQRFSRQEVSFAYLGLVSDSGESSDIFQSTLHTRNAVRGLGDSNDTGYSSPAFDAALETAVRSEPSGRQALLRRCMRIVMEDLPLVPVIERRRLYGVREEILWETRADGRILAQDLRRVTERR